MANNVRFTHPRKSSSVFRANISPQLTATQAILELLSPSTGPFLQPLQPGQDYMLVLSRTNTVIPANVTMGAAGVVDNDTISIILNAMAACSCDVTISQNLKI